VEKALAGALAKPPSSLAMARPARSLPPSTLTKLGQKALT